MWSLIRAELTRLRWRRAVVVLIAAMILVPGLLLAAEVWNTKPYSTSEIAQAQREVDDANASNTSSLDDCLEMPEDWGVASSHPEEQIQAECEAMTTSTLADWLYRPQLNIETFRTETGTAVVIVLGLIAALVGATFAGHDWASGSMSNQLLFESRRGRVWSAKLVALVLLVAATTVVALALVWLGVWAVAESRDVSAGASVWGDVLTTQLRGVLLVSSIAAFGYALTMWFRSTVGALGVMFGLFVASSILLSALFPDTSGRWTIGTNAYALLTGGAEYWVQSGSSCDEFGDCNEYRTVTAAQGALYLGTLLAVALVPSVLSFRRRDLP